MSVTTVDSGETVVFNSTETNLLVNNLQSSTKYSVAVSAVNADGMGPFSDPSAVETLGMLSLFTKCNDEQPAQLLFPCRLHM